MEEIRARSFCLPPGAAAGAWECNKADWMVKIELEAAEALAGLAHSAVSTENRGGDSPMSAEPVNHEERSEFDPVDSEPPAPSHLAQDHGTLQQQHCEKRHKIVTKPIKDEEFSDAELNPASTTSYASSGAGKSRQNLTEAEKEARRIRRVLANRESARQTIRRRQAIFEDLTRKAADLAWENENLKREMELAVKEYDSVKSTNESLKTQLTNMVKAEAEETQEEIHAGIALCPAAESPFQISNQPVFFPFLWPSIVQPPNPVHLQCGPQGSIIFPLPVPSGKLDPSSYDERNPIISNGSGTPLYVLPCPLFFPLPQQSKEHPPQSFNLNDQPNETPQINQCSHSSSAEPSVQIENQHLLPNRVKAHTSMSENTVLGNKLHDNLFGFPSDGGGQHKGSPRRGNVRMPVPLRCVRPEVVEHEKSPRPEDTCEVKTVPTSASDRVGGGLEKNQELMISVGKKMEGVVAAAKARKRRKELTELKNLNCRQYRMQHVE